MLSQSTMMYPNTILSDSWSKSSSCLPQLNSRLEKENAYRTESLLNKYKYKTELCKNWEERGYCPYGTKCRFAHGSFELNSKEKINDKYKSKPCQAFFNTMFCSYGNRCLFKHDERTVKDISKDYYVSLNKYPNIWASVPKRRLAAFINLANNNTHNDTKVIVKDVLQNNKRLQLL